MVYIFSGLVGAGVLAIIYFICRLDAVKLFFANLKYQATGLKQYWIFAIPFSIIYFIVCVYIIFSGDYKDSVLSTISNSTQIFILIFAVFVGYFAFLQASEGQFDKIKKEAGKISGGNGKLTKAKRLYIKAFKINNKESEVLLNLIEVLILLDKRQEVANYIKNADLLFEKDECTEDDDRADLLFLKALFSIFTENPSVADQKINELIVFINNKGIGINWNYKQIKASTKYSNLASDLKTKLDNLLFYLDGKLDVEQEKAFRDDKNYMLTNYKPSVLK